MSDLTFFVLIWSSVENRLPARSRLWSGQFTDLPGRKLPPLGVQHSHLGPPDRPADGVCARAVHQLHAQRRATLGQPVQRDQPGPREALGELAGHRVGHRTADDPEKRRPDLTLARERLGFEPAVSAEDGLRRTIAYFAG